LQEIITVAAIAILKIEFFILLNLNVIGCVNFNDFVKFL